MSVITITVNESSVQLVYGIPRTVELIPNIPSTIFYTINSSDPDTSSDIYIETLKLPTDKNSVILKFFATDGINSSPIITKVYAPDVSTVRKAHAKILNQGQPILDSYPFSSFVTTDAPIYGGIAETPVDSTAIINTIIDGYGPNGEPVLDIDKPLEELEIRFSESDYLGQRGRGIGTLPTVRLRPPDLKMSDEQMSSNIKDKMFNPRALVIHQDSRDELMDSDISHANRAFFNTEDNNKVKSGNNYFTTGSEGATITGSFVKSYFNPRDNTITYYYHDSATLRWIISKEPYLPKQTSTGLYTVVFNSRGGAGDKVFTWNPFRGRRLI